jgi:aryl-alcohol dehydrogenase-like predicted oxidoreductase
MTDMQYTTLGDTGLEVSRLCLGCMNFGSGAEWMMNDRDASLDLLHRAFELGFNFLDTANVYSQGESEDIVGEAIAEQEVFSREELVVATKVFGPMGDGPNQQGLSRKHILDQCEASLDRLGLDYIDLYQIHRWDDDTPVEETLSALDHLVETGKVRYVGASTMTSYEFTKALYTADVQNYERFVCMQPEYNAVDRHEEANLLPVCEGEGVGVIPWSPLAGGFLTGKYDRDADRSAGEEGSDVRRADTDEYTENRFTDENWAVLDEIEAIADELEVTPAQVSLAWLLHKPVVDSPILGPRSVEHLEENVDALDVTLTDDHLARIEAPKTPRWPAPGKD